ncbi:hypothetical protein M433DRAFT_70768 [Acidomyces richmondensis BFW]|nr:MAG: hypothetical protein FE78DRAFT_153087 [Acidomyces sp. 'richmondensis']KYG43854.1 hypothetical protein M433DRAFT_70768 [Acidomyces richmondensis BFW]
MPHIVLLGTADTKLDELLYLREQILEQGGTDCKVTFVDVGRSAVQHKHINVTQDVLITHYSPKDDPRDVSKLPRGEVIKHMMACAINWLRQAFDAGLQHHDCAIHAVVSAGGSGGTSLASGVMREVLPMGLPKLIVSTTASGDTRPVVGEIDITMMYSVCDIAGLNHLLRQILCNAGGAIAGMAKAYERFLAKESKPAAEQHKKRVGLTMFGVTTPCVDKVREYLVNNYPLETYVFHCTGTGGRAMERLVDEGVLEAVLDVTTTEICDHICGGVMDAGPRRLESPLKNGIPHLISVGALDMVNFGPKATVPEKYRGRNLFEHNPLVTLMRTNAEESEMIGKFIAGKIKDFAKDREKVQVVLPTGGVSIISVQNAPFHDREADQALFSTIKDELNGSNVIVIEDQRDINDPGFAVDLAKRFVRMMGLER